MTARPTIPTICGAAWLCADCRARVRDTEARWRYFRAPDRTIVEALCVPCAEAGR